MLGLMIIILTGCQNPEVQKSYFGPDENLALQLHDNGERLNFSVQYGDTPIIEPSPLSMIVDGHELLQGVEILDVKLYEEDEKYERLGAHKFAENNFKGAQIELAQGDGLKYKMDVRVYNDAAAYRFIIPGDGNDKRIPDELTEFKLPVETTVWYHDLHMHYESVHDKNDIGDIPNGEWMAPPVTFKLNNGIYASITEANLKNYSGMALQKQDGQGIQIRLAHHQPVSYPYELRYDQEDVARLAKPAMVEGDIITPWRLVMVGSDLNMMVNNDAVYHLNPDPEKRLFPNGMKSDWIKPGRAVWKYLDGGGEGTLETMKKFTDQAAELGFEHNILEGFWAKWPEGEVKELVEYSKEKGVGTWLWKHSKSLRDKGDRLKFFDQCEEWGITGVKLDFFDHEAKEVIDLYQDILRETAERKILVNFHGANKPTGESKTWPNELTREAIRGMESSKLEDRATHNTTVPFTRFLAGHAEYTPVHFGERRKNTTWAHQIASAAIMNTPLLTYAANPQHILENPAVELIKKIPAYWDETIVLAPSEIGELAVFARRKGETWYLAIMNGTEAKSLDIPLAFLKDKQYEVLSARDNPESDADILVDNGLVEGQNSISIDLNEGGGYVAIFTETN